MPRSRFLVPLAAVFALGASIFPQTARAAGSSIFSPIIPQTGSCVCANSAPDWGCVLQVIQNVISTAVSLGVVLCVLYIAYAGFTLITSGGSPEARSQGKTRIMNAVVGIVVILASWLIVDFVMKTIYNPDTVFKSDVFGPWNGILASNGNDYCIRVTTPVSITSGLVDILTGIPGQTTSGGALGLGTGTGACNPTQVSAAASAGGYTLTPNQANALACIARPESACGSNTGGATTPGGKATSASGPWQIIVGAKDACHSLNIPACGNLNCSAAYSGGRVKSDAVSQALAARCQAAANDLKCSASAAACIIQASGGKFSAWTADPRSSTQKACVTANGLSY